MTTQEDRWEAALSYRAADGKLKRRCSYHPCREEADRALTRMKADRDGGMTLDSVNPTLEEYLVTWLRDSVAISVAPKSQDRVADARSRLHKITIDAYSHVMPKSSKRRH